MGKIYVIRHGETDVNIKNQINGRNDGMLNEVGINQAKKVRINSLDIDFIICSPLERTKQTCKYLNTENKPVLYDDRLMERDAKSMQYKLVEELDLNVWYDTKKDIVYDDSEGFGSVLKRVYRLLDEIKDNYSSSKILLVTHGDVCRAIHMYFNADTYLYDISKFEMKNCEIHEYKF